MSSTPSARDADDGEKVRITAEERRQIQARAYETAFATWFASLSHDEQLRMEQLGIDKPIVEHSRKPRSCADGEERRDRDEDLPDPDRPVMSESEVAEFEAAFGAALAWAAQGGSLVEMGRRMTAMLQIYKPALLAGLSIEIEQELTSELQAEKWREDEEKVGDLYGCALEWITRGKSLSQWGQRLMAALYVMRPGAIEDRTLEKIGDLSNKTRQAVDKAVQDFRDTFGGIKSAAMRSDETRERCKIAQLQRA